MISIKNYTVSDLLLNHPFGNRVDSWRSRWWSWRISIGRSWCTWAIPWTCQASWWDVPILKHVINLTINIILKTGREEVTDDDKKSQGSSKSKSEKLTLKNLGPKLPPMPTLPPQPDTFSPLLDQLKPSLLKQLQQSLSQVKGLSYIWYAKPLCCNMISYTFDGLRNPYFEKNANLPVNS